MGRPTSVHARIGSVTVDGDAPDFRLTMQGDSTITLDFGVEVGGLITCSVLVHGSRTTVLSLTFSESPLFAGPNSDDTGATPTMDWDRSLAVDLPDAKLGTWYNYKMPSEKHRGGFRFVTFICDSETETEIEIRDIKCEIGFAPDAKDLRQYTGWFHCDDELLNRIWYAGAYTVQTNIVPNNTGRHLPQVRPGWQYSAPLGIGSPILVDGAKRDRAIWPGDMGIAIPSCLLAFGSKLGWPAVHNALETVFENQHEDGQLIFAGPSTMSFNKGSRSQTYHFWTLVACNDLWDWGGEQKEYIKTRWGSIANALKYSLGSIGSSGLIEQTQLSDWGRDGSGGLNAALNALAYRAFEGFYSICQEVVDDHLCNALGTAAENLREGFNDLLWDEQAGMYRDHEQAEFCSQDGNSLALAYDLVDFDRTARVSEGLARYWNEIGPVCPELADTISPFISSIEVQAHFRAGQPARAVELIRRLWGYMLNAPQMTGSTLVEGMTADGSLSYRAEAGYHHDPSYISHAHSWSSGPTSSLMYSLLGLQVEAQPAAAGLTCRLSPCVAGVDVDHAEGGFETANGTVSAQWAWDKTSKIWTARIASPRVDGGNWSIGVPDAFGHLTKVTIDGRATQRENELNEIEPGIHIVQAHFS